MSFTDAAPCDLACAAPGLCVLDNTDSPVCQCPTGYVVNGLECDGKLNTNKFHRIYLVRHAWKVW